MDGAVGCVSLCPRELMLPKLGCAKPDRVKVLGRCCEQLVCPEEAKPEISLRKKHRRKDSKYRTSENDLTNQYELAPVWTGESGLTAGEWLVKALRRRQGNVWNYICGYMKMTLCDYLLQVHQIVLLCHLKCLHFPLISVQESPSEPHLCQRIQVCVSHHSLVRLLQIQWHRSVHQADQQQSSVQTHGRDSHL